MVCTVRSCCVLRRWDGGRVGKGDAAEQICAFLSSVEKNNKRNALCGGQCCFCGTLPQLCECVRNAAIWYESWCQSCSGIMLLSLLYSDSLLWTVFLASKGRKCFRINPKDWYTGDLCSSWARYKRYKPRTDNMLYAQRVLAGGHQRHNIVCAQEGGFLCVTAGNSWSVWVPVFFKEAVLTKERRLVSLSVLFSQIVVLHHMEIQSSHYKFWLPQNCHYRWDFWLHETVIILLKSQIWKKKSFFLSMYSEANTPNQSHSHLLFGILNEQYWCPNFYFETQNICLVFFSLEFKIQYIYFESIFFLCFNVTVFCQRDFEVGKRGMFWSMFSWTFVTACLKR